MKKIIRLAAVLLGLGLIFFFISYLMTGGRFSSLGSRQYREKSVTYSSKDIRRLNIDTSVTDIEIRASNQDKVRVTYPDDVRTREEDYQISNRDGELTIFGRNERGFLQFHLNFIDLFSNFSKKLILEVPADQFEDLSVDADGGDVKVSDLDLQGQFTLDTDMGDVNISRTTVQGDFQVGSKAGSIEIDGLSAQNMKLTSSMGDISLREAAADKSVIADSSNGSIRLVKLAAGQAVELNSSMGDISGSIQGKQSDFNISSDASIGDSKLPESQSGGHKTLKVSADAGDISLDFTD